uniref:Uncharacterized protein n=1 Tax=Arundo donax TaxID=35708 RepID=A0A0A9FBK3_ARUDO
MACERVSALDSSSARSRLDASARSACSSASSAASEVSILAMDRFLPSFFSPPPPPSSPHAPPPPPSAAPRCFLLRPLVMGTASASSASGDGTAASWRKE